MRRFIALQNIVYLKGQLESEADPKQRVIIERLIYQEEGELASVESRQLATRRFVVARQSLTSGGSKR